MASALNRRFPEVLTLAFEYATPVRDGRGKASFTDLMLLGESISVAIEAKYTEPQYQSTNEWLGTEPSDNRRRVLAGWLAAIKEAAGADITERVGDLPYQLIHRTASVCCAPGPDRMLIYQVFGHNPPAHYSDAMVALDRLLGPNSCVGFYLHTCPYEPTGIWAPRPRGASALMTAAQIRKALLADPEDLEPGTLIPVAA